MAYFLLGHPVDNRTKYAYAQSFNQSNCNNAETNSVMHSSISFLYSFEKCIITVHSITR